MRAQQSFIPPQQHPQAAAAAQMMSEKQQKMSEVERIKQELLGYQRELEMLQKKREYAKQLKQQQQQKQQQQEVDDDDDDEKRFERVERRAEVREKEELNAASHTKHFHRHENPPFETAAAIGVQIQENAIEMHSTKLGSPNGGLKQQSNDDSEDVAEMIKQFRLKETETTKPTIESTDVQDTNNTNNPSSSTVI